MSYSHQQTRTYQISGGRGPSSTRTIVTHTVSSPDGPGTRTFPGDDRPPASNNMDYGGFNSGFSNMKIGGSGEGMLSYQRHRPTESRYNQGWGQRKQKQTGPPKALTGKTFQEIRAQCKKEGRLFEDPDFPAVDSSIFYSRAPPRPFVWKRPTELCSNPELFVGGASRMDVKQGELGDCWLLAAVACLCSNKNLLYRVVPQDQGFGPDYAGVFHFQIWQYGQWEDVIIDDRLPTYYDKLVFMHSADNNEFWTPLLEKAYAKLCGTYEALKGGASSEAMEDFTGGVTENVDLKNNVQSSLFQIMLKGMERSSMLGCSIEASPGKMEAELPNGLIMGHAYSVTSVKLVEIQTSKMKGKIPLVRVRNPWGNECEWKGSWSDKSPEWKFIPEEERERMGLTFDDDGEFWMSYQDFTSNFQKLEMCNLGPSDQVGGPTFEATQFQGSWKKGVNAGGCRNYLETFWTNPQYRVDVQDADDDDDLGTLIIALMQKNRRKMRKEGLDLLTIGYSIYKVPDELKDPNCGPLDMRFFKYNGSVGKSPAFINLREVCGRHKLPPGAYCIIPSTFEANQEGDFLLRIFSEKPNDTKEIDEETSISDVQDSQTANKPEAPQVEMTAEDKKQDGVMRDAFRKIAGEDMEIDAYELQDVLNAAFMKEFQFDGFSCETCRSLVAMMDVDQSGRLGYDEFKKLWADLRVWKLAFKQFDKDKSGTFNSYELRQAFHYCGFTLSNSTFNALVQRYSHKDGKIHFDDYIHCIARLKTMFDVFRERDSQAGKALFTLDEFIQTTMYS